MAAPTADEIRKWSKVPFDEVGYEKGADDPLTLEVERAVEQVENATGRDFDDPPEDLTLTLQECVQRWVEWAVYSGNEEAVETAGDFDLIKSLSAGSYNEQRRDLGEADKAKVVHPWPKLNALLWAAMTEDKKDEWREKWGVIVPAWAITEVDWQASDLLPDPYLDDGLGPAT